MTPHAGTTAAGARRLILTHIGHALTLDEPAAGAAITFGGIVEYAAPNASSLI